MAGDRRAILYCELSLSTFAERINAESDDRFVDSIIIAHGFATYSRDYDIVILTVAALPAGVPIGDSTGTYVDARFRYRFTHCPEAHLISALEDEWWSVSWDDLFTDYTEWEARGHPEGFVWGTKRADAYPGLSYVSDSTMAASWSERLHREMHELLIETNVFNLSLVCHGLRVYKEAVGDPRTHTMTDLKQPQLMELMSDDVS